MAKAIVILCAMLLASVSVFADVSIVKIEGPDHLSQYVKPGDSLTIEIFATDLGIAVSDPNLIRFEGMPNAGKFDPNYAGLPFNACSGGRCSIVVPSGYFSFVTNPLLITVHQYNCTTSSSCAWKDSASIDLIEDNVAPAITLTGHGNTIGLNGVTVNYTAMDTACATCGSSQCSGINRLEFNSSQLGGVGLVAIFGAAGTCTENGGKIFLPADISLGSGAVSLSAKVFDNFGMSSKSNTLNFIVDLTAPFINTSSFTIRDELGGNATIIPPRTFKVDISIQVIEPDLANVTLDESVLNPALGVVKGTCTSSGNKSTCSWSDIPLALSADVNAALLFTASDVVGNTVSATVMHAFDVANTDPVVASILSSSGSNYLSGSDVIIVDISPGEGGFANHFVYMDLSSLQTGISNVQATNCNGSWSCYFPVTPDQPDGIHTVNVLPSSIDDLGNSINASLSIMNASFILDRTAPVISNVQYLPSKPMTTDTLIITFDVVEANNVFATVDTSQISASASETATCINTSAQAYNCSVTVSSLIAANDAPITVTAADDVGNQATPVDAAVTIYYTDTGTTPDCLTLSGVSTIPATIDKKVASQVDMQIFAQVSLASLCTDLNITKNTFFFRRT